MFKRGVLTAILFILCALSVNAYLYSITAVACPGMCGSNQTCAARCTRLVNWCAQETRVYSTTVNNDTAICYDTMEFSTCAHGITATPACKRALLDLAGPEGPLLKCNLPSYCKESVFVCSYQSTGLPGCPARIDYRTAVTVPAWFCPKPDYTQNFRIFPRCFQIYDSAGTYGFQRQWVQVCPRGLSSKAFMDGECTVEDYIHNVQGPDTAANRQECENLAGMWFPGAPAGYHCCGDNRVNASDFMMLVNAGLPTAGLCVHTPQRWQWITRGDAGRIYRVELEGVLKGSEAVWTDNGPRVCGPTVAGSVGNPLPLGVETFTAELFKEDPFLQPITVVNDYTCTRAGASAFAAVECKGNHDPWSDQNQNPLRVHGSGSNVTSIFDTQPYWCGSEGLWKRSLDADQDACTLAGQQKMNPATKVLPIVWTGTRCCGEEQNEFYNDPLSAPSKDAKGNYMPPFSISGCWNSNPVRGTGKVRRFLDEVVPADPIFEKNGGDVKALSIINYNGTFHGCQLPPSLGSLTPTNTSDTVCDNCTVPYPVPVVVNVTNVTLGPVWHSLCTNCTLLTDRNGLYQVRYGTNKLLYCSGTSITRIDRRSDCQAGGECTDIEKGWLCVGQASGCAYKGLQKCGTTWLYKTACKNQTAILSCY